MWTARDVTLRLRRELDDDRLLVKLDPIGGRWQVCVCRKMLTGARAWPVRLLDDGQVVAGGPTRLREVALLEDVVYVLEVGGEYHSLEPNLMRRALIERDTHRRNVARELLAEVARRKAAREKAFRDDALQRAKHYRRAFARVAEDLGYGGRPDYSQLTTRLTGV